MTPNTPYGRRTTLHFSADEVDRFLHFAGRLETRLADLDQAGDGEIPLALFDEVGAGAEDRDSPLPAEVAPLRKRGACGVDRLVDQRGILRKLAEQDLAVDRADGAGDRAFAPVAPGDEGGARFSEQPCLGAGDDLVEMCVDAREILAGVGVSDARKVIHRRGSSSRL